MCKYVFVSGGVISSVGKGAAISSLAMLLSMRGLKVQVIKFDPYLNTSASQISPFQHGETWVCSDGTETDLDLGNYYRMAGIDVSSKNICTSGKLYEEIIRQEKEGKFLGQTIQVGHIVNRIQEMLIDLGKDSDVCLVEIGGCCGDVESYHFYEAIRQFKHKLGVDNALIVHVAPILWINTIGEFKTKPLQASITELRRFGLDADILLCRVDRAIDPKILDKISKLMGIDRNAIFEAPDAKTVYQVPIHFYDRHIDDLIVDKFKLKRSGVRIHKYRDLVEKYVKADNLQKITLAVLGKYTNLQDAYASLKEAIYHAAVANNCSVEIKWLNSESLEEYTTSRGVSKFFEGIDAVIVPGGFDVRGVEGKILGINYVREKKIPFLGICLGLQCAVIEYARNVCDIGNANSTEFNKECEPVVHLIPGTEKIHRFGGTLRLGDYECVIVKDSLAHKVYDKKSIHETHRHRYEVNSAYLKNYEAKGLNVTGIHPETGLVEIMELDKKIHPYFVMCQFHPEFKSRLTTPHPLFDNLIHFALSGKLKEKE
jgi:CTP synthase